MVRNKPLSLYPFLFAAMPLLLAFGVAAAPPKKQTPKLSYNKDIRPILADNCFPCHGPDSAARKAGLRLDRAADALAKRVEGAAIVPGNPKASLVMQRILEPGDSPLRMPPAAGHKHLSVKETDILTQWIADGATYEQHWAYLPPKRVVPPTVKNIKWVRNPIDNFVLAKLEASGLSPAPEADRRTLVRRVSLDVTGLPPKPAEVVAFLNDTSANAYEKMVDRYLASPHWGEHRGRYWLDAARYADTHGIHFDNYREMWSYRDWVINAFNANMPFDEFSIEQIAGDLLPNPTLDQQIATGFNRCNITTNEGGSIDEEVAVMYTRDRTETTSEVFMATTAGCAVCHDHKFDPLSQKEMYALSAYFNNTTQKAMDGNIKDTPPTLPVPRPEDRPRLEALKTEIAQTRELANKRKETARPAFDGWLASADTGKIAQAIPTDNLRLYAPLNEGTGTQIAVTEDGKSVKLNASAEPTWDSGYVADKAFQRKGGSTVVIPAVGDFENNQSFTASVWVKATDNPNGALIARMDEQNDYRGWDMWLQNGRVAMHIINKWPADALKVVSRDMISPNQWHNLCITYNGGMKKDAIQIYVDGVQKATDAEVDALKSTIRTTTPFKIGQRSNGQAVEGASLQDVRIYDKALTLAEIQALAAKRTLYLLSRGVDKLAAPEKDELFNGYLSGVDKEYQDLNAKLAAEQGEDTMIRQRGTVALVAHEKDEAAMAYVLFRGEYDQRRDKVTPMTPAFLPKMPDSFPKNRLGFAKWLFLPEHPLTARVTVNRFWQETFGTGIVRTSEDFGIAGEQPSHPELLDWLAVDFRTHKWDVKRFYKQMLMSATYRQSSIVTPRKKQLDPSNRLLSRGPRFRMDAEMVRDYALASSGLLVDVQGGPSVKPYQPDGVWEAVAMRESDTSIYRRDGGASLYRRSLYTFWKRSAPPASMDIFNAPSREKCTLRRERTNTPLQALVTMNDTQYIEAARRMAERALLIGGKTDDARLDFIAQRLLARPLKEQEQVVLELCLDDLAKYYQANPKDANELIKVGESKAEDSIKPESLATWTMLVNQMMNMDEVLTK